MMAAKALPLPDSEWDQMLEDSKSMPVIVDFSAGWCGPCKLMGPLIDQIAEEYDSKVKVFVFDVDNNKARAKELGITGLPFVTAFKDGEIINEDQIRGMPKNAKVLLKKMADRSLAA